MPGAPCHTPKKNTLPLFTVYSPPAHPIPGAPYQAHLSSFLP